MNKLKNMIKKYDVPFIIIISILIITGFILNVEAQAGDELWNFANIYKIYNGNQIYSDINVIITPLFFVIGNLLFKLLSANILVFKLYDLIIAISLILVVYLILKKSIKDKKISMIVVMCFIFYFIGIFIGGANYNTLALVFCFIGIYYIISHKEKRNYILQGTIAFIIFLIKQNMGVYYILGLVIYELFINRKIKEILITSITFLAELIITLAIFQMNGNLYNFMDFAFGGIGEFASKNASFTTVAGLSAILINLLITIASIYIIKNQKIEIKEEVKENLKIFCSFLLPLTLVIYPIANEYHTRMSYILTIIIVVYIVYQFIEGIKINKILQIVFCAIVGLAISFSVFLLINYIIKINSKEYKFEVDSPYFGILMKEEKYEDLKQIDEYIMQNEKNGIKVKILSHQALWYVTPLKQNNGVMDLPFKGNLGSRGEDGLIDDIKKLYNTKILLQKEKDKKYQESEKVENFIKENYEKVEEIGIFEVYYIE